MLGKKNDGRQGELKVQLVGEGEERRADVRDALAALGDPVLNIVELEPDPDPAPDASVDVTMVVFNGDDELSLSYLNAQAGQEPRPVLFALLRDRSPDLMKRVLRAGADELLFLPLDPGDATRALLKISETRRREEVHNVHNGGGMIVSLVSLIGGTGVTSLAANLALALRYTFEKRVAVIDLDLQTGGLAVFLNLEPERTIMALAEGTRKLDSIQLESALSKHASGIYLLAAPKRIEDSELVSDETVGAILDLTRQLFDFVIVDCGTHIDANTVAAWERS
ncbi:MAG TPA: AAA family ATPase, partial [Candidatus Binataceae bacterium]|nr:AAA family ATPase [Candidatus Binataceae bacterium]